MDCVRVRARSFFCFLVECSCSSRAMEWLELDAALVSSLLYRRANTVSDLSSVFLFVPSPEALIRTSQFNSFLLSTTHNR